MISTNNLDNTLIGHGSMESIWNANGTKILKYQQEIWHEGIKDHKVITAPEKEILINKVRVQVDKWNQKWNEILQKQRIEDAKKASVDEAMRRTMLAEERIAEAENILISTLETNHAIDWESLKDRKEFSEPFPVKPSDPILAILPVSPDRNAPEFQPKLNILTSLFKSLKNKAIIESEQKYKMAYDESERLYNEKLLQNNNLIEQHQKSLEAYDTKVKEWNKRKKNIYRNKMNLMRVLMSLRINTLITIRKP